MNSTTTHDSISNAVGPSDIDDDTIDSSVTNQASPTTNDSSDSDNTN